MNSSLVI